MADVTYIVNQDDPNNIPGFENYSQADLNLIQQYQVNSLFDVNKHFVELYITDLAGNIIENDVNYTSYKLLGTAQSAGREGASILTIDPIQDSKTYGYDNGGIKLLYHFLNDLYTLDKTTTQFYISAISPDRTELQLQNLSLTNEQIISFTSEIKNRLATQSYFSEFRLNFGDNDLFIGVNIDNLIVEGDQTVVVKLYEPLPSIYDIKSTLALVETISDSVAFEVDTIIQFPEETANTLRPANFNLDVTDNQVVPTQYLGFNDLFSYPVNNTNNQLYSLVNEKGAELSIDHTDYSDFVHFSSAYERLVNFKYKLQLIESYTTNLSLIQTATSQSVGITGSVTYYENLITGIVNNFDHYERYLYYQSSSYAWPKSNSTQPYTNYPSTSSQGINWYANQLAVANGYDLSNGSLLINSIPTYLRDDPNNENYLTFIHMIGQHFDNLWIYAKSVTDKYDGDNRLDHGISKDLVGEALRSFGVKLYTSNKSIEDLFGSFIGQGYQSGSETINTYVTGSVTGSGLPVEDISFNDYTKEVQKRIYHNLPFILKTKGTERGVRALINCFGIPSDILKIKIYGGRNTDERPFYGDFKYFTGSLDKIRLDNTGSLVTGSTLSQYTSIIHRDKKYTDDLHNVEIGFSPVDNIDNLIVSYSLATSSLSTFNIDNYIGDPRNLNSNSYTLLDSSGNTILTLQQITNQIMSSSAAYDVQDYVRLIKFFDNVIFKMVRDYVPARTVADTGIVIKPHLLQRSKAKSPTVTVTQPEYSQSIDTAFTSASNGDTFGSRDQYTTVTYQDPSNISTNYRIIQTPLGLGADYRHGHEETKFDGDFSGSNVTVTNGNLTQANPYTTQVFTSLTYNVVLVSGSDVVCLLGPITAPIQIQPGESYTAATFFTGPQTYNIYTASIVGGSTVNIPAFPYTFTDTNFQQYQVLTLQATASNIAGCQTSTQAMYASCSVQTTGNAPGQVVPGDAYNITQWFTPVNSNITYYINGTQQLNPTSTIFTGPAGTSYEVQARDETMTSFGLTCNTSITTVVNSGCPITLPSNGVVYDFNNTSQFVANTSGNPDTYIVCRSSIGQTIKSLFSTGTDDPSTYYDVWIRTTSDGGVPNYITPGTNQYSTNPTPWSGNEVVTLNYYTDGAGYWAMQVQGGIFDSSDIWFTDQPIPLDTTNILIRAYSTNPFYGTCNQIVTLRPPRQLIDTGCVRGVHYECVLSELTNQYEAVYYSVPNTCLSSEDPCNYLNT